LTLTGGSFGLQIGGQAIDVVLVIMNRQGLENLLGNQFTLGVDASAAAGPVGRDAEVSTDVQMRATILSYSRARGLFAGVTVKGAAIRRDKDSNEDFYGHPYETREIVLDGQVASHVPDAVGRWRKTLNRFANRRVPTGR
jgi:lipid-binding SYLF domain-containing protein